MCPRERKKETEDGKRGKLGDAGNKLTSTCDVGSLCSQVAVSSPPPLRPPVCVILSIFVYACFSHSHTLTLSHSHTLTLSHSHTFTISHTLTLSHSHTLTLLHLHTLTLSHSHTLTLSHSHTLTLSHSHTLTLSREGENAIKVRGQKKEQEK